MENQNLNIKKKKFFQKKWFKILFTLFVLGAVTGGALLWKMGITLNKISLKGNLLESLFQSLPGGEDTLKGESEGRINVVLLGMRGENVPGGGLLADTIIVMSILPNEKKAAMISIPRDLYVHNPVWGNTTKINSVYAAGEENGKREGIAQMEKVLTEVTGQTIHYGISINFQGFVELVDALGGIEINLEKPFQESLQFNEPHVCDSNVYTVPTGQYELKKRKKSNGQVKIVKRYPLCYPDPKYVECGGNFTLPAGKSLLDGKKALCYVRSRYSTNDFDRARRQQEVLKLIRDKALALGTLTDFSKINGVLDALGNNVRTDMEPWEIKRFFDLYTKMQDYQIYQRVLDNSESGLLYAPPQTKETGYILMPIGDNYDKIHELFRNIFNEANQSQSTK